MEKTYKFRAWNKISKKWMRVTNYFAFDVDGSIYEPVTPEEVDLVLMQSTGIKDKHGVEVFEGDIVRRSDKNTIGEVRWCNGRFEIQYDECRENIWEMKSQYLTIIGNIYSNPELLK